MPSRSSVLGGLIGLGSAVIVTACTEREVNVHHFERVRSVDGCLEGVEGVTPRPFRHWREAIHAKSRASVGAQLFVSADRHCLFIRQLEWKGRLYAPDSATMDDPEWIVDVDDAIPDDEVECITTFTIEDSCAWQDLQ